MAADKDEKEDSGEGKEDSEGESEESSEGGDSEEGGEEESGGDDEEEEEEEEEEDEPEDPKPQLEAGEYICFWISGRWCIRKRMQLPAERAVWSLDDSWMCWRSFAETARRPMANEYIYRLPQDRPMRAPQAPL